MPNKQHVMAMGGSAGLAGATVGGIVTQAVSGSASTDATLMPLGSHFVCSTSSSNQGMIFPPGNGALDGLVAGDWGTINNATANTIKVYPPKGGTINTGSTDAAVSMTTHQTGWWVCIDGLKFILTVV